MISVIVPVYNAENYIDACIHSILQQTYEDFELILVDDGSTDRSGIIIDTYADEYEKIHVVHSANGGAAAARNLGVKNANGRWVCFVDADDTIEPGYLRYLMELRNEFNADIAICGYEVIYADKKDESLDDSETVKEKSRYAMTGVEAMEDLLYQRHFMSVPWGYISKLSQWDNISFPEGAKAEDMATIYKLYAMAGRVAYGDKKLYNYYQRKSNTIYSTESVRNIDYYKHCKEMIVYVGTNYNKQLPAAYSRHFSACFQILSETPMKKKNKKLIASVYKDIRRIQISVLKDKHAKTRNRCAALMSLVSVRMMHCMLRAFYKIKKSRAA